MEYAGESLAKKVARVRLYRRTRAMLEAADVAPGTARCLFLAGPESAELGAIRHILRADMAHSIGIDRDPAACKALRKKWPGGNVVCGDLASWRAHRTMGTYA